MKMKYILLYTISILCASTYVSAQETTDETITDTTNVAVQKYGLRIGGDLSKLARTAFEEGYTGNNVYETPEIFMIPLKYGFSIPQWWS